MHECWYFSRCLKKKNHLESCQEPEFNAVGFEKEESAPGAWLGGARGDARAESIV